jgi:hypothetical protein
MSDDIVARLREIPTAWPLVDEAVEEIERLRAEVERLRAGGCARDQTTTQFCAEVERLLQEREREVR